MNPCESFESMIALDAGGDLASAESASLLQHLRTCQACRDFAEAMRESRQALTLLASAPIDEACLASVRAGVMERLDVRRGRRSAFAFSGRQLALAATLIVALAAAALLRSSWLIDTGKPPDPSATESPILETAPKTIVAETPTHSSRAVHLTPVPTAPVPTVTAPATQVAETPPLVATRRPLDPALTIAESTPNTSFEGPALATAESPTETTVIKLISEEADLVIYWFVQPEAELTQEKNHESSAV